MNIVGKKLEDWALEQTDFSSKDFFGRSAFNRFYYAAFLVTREMIGALDAKWTNTNHNQIPDLLEGSVKDPVKEELQASVKKGLITAGERSRFLTTLNYASSELANLLRWAYDIRCIADYEPEIKIEQKAKVIFLNEYKLASASTWPDRANAYCKAIRKVWGDTGLA